MPIDGPLMAIDGPHGTAMAIDELRWDLSTGSFILSVTRALLIKQRNSVKMFSEKSRNLVKVRRNA